MIPPIGDEPTWFVDPLDGTTNFVHGFPFSCVSIGLAGAALCTLGEVGTSGLPPPWLSLHLKLRLEPRRLDLAFKLEG